uniref:Uncharacterized protein n=1 Tax=Anopheles atroparvus TaxID=41427 RepID=A0A182JGD9_ANOAO
MGSKGYQPTMVFLALLALAGAAQLDEPTPFLIGGGPATIGQFPAQVGIQIGTTLFCGGSILNQNHVLTAASCVLDANNNLVAANQLTVRAGVLQIDASAPALTVQRIFPHQHFNPWTFENDIAVLRMTVNFSFPLVALPNMGPAELNHHIVRDQATCYVVGWNWQQATPNVVLQVLAVQFAPRQDCNTVHNGMLRDSMACTTYTGQNQGVCAPNRGGGLYCNGLLTGVISFGFGCGTNTTMTVHSQVRYYSHWIQQQFVRTDTPPAGPTPMPGLGGFGPGAASSFSLSLAAALVAASPGQLGQLTFLVIGEHQRGLFQHSIPLAPAEHHRSIVMLRFVRRRLPAKLPERTQHHEPLVGRMVQLPVDAAAERAPGCMSAPGFAQDVGWTSSSSSLSSKSSNAARPHDHVDDDGDDDEDDEDLSAIFHHFSTALIFRWRNIHTPVALSRGRVSWDGGFLKLSARSSPLIDDEDDEEDDDGPAAHYGSPESSPGLISQSQSEKLSFHHSPHIPRQTFSHLHTDARRRSLLAAFTAAPLTTTSPSV